MQNKENDTPNSDAPEVFNPAIAETAQQDSQATSAPAVPAELLRQHGLLEDADDGLVTTVAEAPNTVSEAFESAETARAIDDITQHDDAVLLDSRRHDQTESISPAPVPKRSRWLRVRLWWRRPAVHYPVIIGLCLLLVGGILWPPARYGVLNATGARASTTMQVVDNETRLPLQNVTVTIGATTAQTNGDGQATLRNLHLGRQAIVIQRVAFAPVTMTTTIGWGSNPLPNVLLKPTGLKVRFKLTDALSGKPIQKAEALVGQASAFSDAKGMISLSAEDPKSTQIIVTIKADQYKQQQITLAVESAGQQHAVQMLPGQNAVYISKQSGTYNVMTSDALGGHARVLLPGTGHETRDNLRLVTSPDGATAALVSTRTSQLDADGYPLSSLTLVSVSDGALKQIDLAQHIELLGWHGDDLVYEVTYAAASAADSARNKLIAYDVTTDTRTALAQADYFNGEAIVGDTLYYATTQTDPSQPSQFARVTIDKPTEHSTILKKTIWSLVRTGQDTMSLETPDGWFSYVAGDVSVNKGGAADYLDAADYITTLDGTRTAWIEQRDGKGVVLVHTEGATGAHAADKTVAEAGGVTYPLRWLNSTTLTYRVATSDETADYVVSINGGAPHKVTDVTDVTGFAVGSVR